MSQCPSPRELEMFAVAGAAYPAVARHVEHCAACRANVDEIIANQQFLGTFRPVLATAFAAEGDRSTITIANQLPAPGTVPGYELIEEISRGGQGIVYRAFHTETNRAAAVKMLLAGAFASGNQRRRFKREIEIAARFRHPSIVTVFDAGVTTDGRRFIAMEFVDGKPLDRYVRDRWPLKPQPARDRTAHILRLVRAVADGVGYAHSSGVLHRDLKPSNILVEPNGTPRILDFGLARAAEGATVTSEFAGTPAFAAPEQFTIELGAVTTRTDVYALGLILYIALTEAHPYPHAGSFAEMARVAIAMEPVPPSRHVPRLPADVETIVLKALSKDPSRRYSSAGALASDIDDYLAGRPISARRDSTVYVLSRLALRHRLPALAAALLLVIIVAAAIGFALLARKLGAARQEALAALSDSNVHRARLMAAAGDAHRAEERLWSLAIDAGVRVDDSLLYAGSPKQISRAWALAEFYSREPRRFRVTHGETLLDVGISSDAQSVWGFDAAGSRVTWSRDGHFMGFTPARRIDSSGFEADISANGRYEAFRQGNHLTIIDLDSGRTVSRTDSWDPALYVDDLAEDGAHLVAMSSPWDGAAHVFGTEPFGLLDSFSDSAVEGTLAGPPEHRQLVIGTSAGEDPRIVIRSGMNWAHSATIRPPPEFRGLKGNALRRPRLSSDGRWVLTSCRQNILIFDTQAADRQPISASNRALVNRSRFVADASLAVVGLDDGLVTIFTIPGLEPVQTFHNGAGALGVAATTELVAVVDEARRISVYDAAHRPWLQQVSTSPKTNQAIAIGPDGTVAWGNDSGNLSIRAPLPPHQIVTINAQNSEITSIDFSPTTDAILTAGGGNGVLREWSRDGRLIREIASGLPDTWSARYTPDGSAVAVGTRGGEVRLVRPGGPAVAFVGATERVPVIAFSPHGESIITGAAPRGPAVVWDLASGAERFRVHPCASPIRAAAWSPDGRLIITGADDKTVRAWDAITGRPVWTAEGLPWGVFDLAFHPRGTVLFVVGRGPEVVVIDAATGAEIATLRVHDGIIFKLDLAADGTSIVTSGEDDWIGITDLDRLLSYIKGNEAFWRKFAGPVTTPR